jgi:RNA methyltransferase, TrmH family
VLAARKLSRRASRDESNAFRVEGERVVLEALRSPAEVTEVFLHADAARAAEIEAAATDRGVAVVHVAGRVIEALSDTATPQGVVAVVRSVDVHLSAVAAAGGLVVVLADVRDPGNAGTLLRSAVASGAAGVVFARGSVDPLHPKTVRASAGAIFRVPVVRDLAIREAVAGLRDAGRRIIGADAHARRSYEEVDWSRPSALVLGNEAWGLDPDHEDLLDDVVGIPMPGPAESLNVAVAGSILMLDAARPARN